MPNAKVFSAHAYVENFGLVMAGSYADDSMSVTVTRDGLNFEELASLPSGGLSGGSYAGCLAIVDNKTLIYTGGYGETQAKYAVYRYDIPSDSWTR